jgi:hypothetical protein
MRRRDLLRFAADAVARWPKSTHGQQQGGLRRIGVLLGLANGPNDPGAGEILRPLVTSKRGKGMDGRQECSAIAGVNFKAAELPYLPILRDKWR